MKKIYYLLLILPSFVFSYSKLEISNDLTAIKLKFDKIQAQIYLLDKKQVSNLNEKHNSENNTKIFNPRALQSPIFFQNGAPKPILNNKLYNPIQHKINSDHYTSKANNDLKKSKDSKLDITKASDPQSSYPINSNVNSYPIVVRPSITIIFSSSNKDNPTSSHYSYCYNNDNLSNNTIIFHFDNSFTIDDNSDINSISGINGAQILASDTPFYPSQLNSIALAYSKDSKGNLSPLFSIMSTTNTGQGYSYTSKILDVTCTKDTNNPETNCNTYCIIDNGTITQTLY